MSAARKNTEYHEHGGLKVLRDVVVPGSTVARADGGAGHHHPAPRSTLLVVSVASSQIMGE